MRRYESDLVLGTILTFIGYIMFVGAVAANFVSWLLIIVGKLIIFLSIMGYVDRKRSLKGEDLSKDKSWKKKLRKITRKRY